jgi:hypothetical protein
VPGRRGARSLQGLVALAGAALLAACDPGAEAGFAPVEPLPTPHLDAAAAPWWPAHPESVGPDTEVLDVLVLEQECAGGETAEGRIRAPDIRADDALVVVAFVVEVRTDPLTCPDNPPTPAVLELPEPLGDRALLDGVTDPPRPPTPVD